jgi:uncharacterized membrane protein
MGFAWILSQAARIDRAITLWIFHDFLPHSLYKEIKQVYGFPLSSPFYGSFSGTMIVGTAYSQEQEKRLNPVIVRVLRGLQRNVFAGIITIGPLFVTYLIFSFLLGALEHAGLPAVRLFAVLFPEAWLSQPWLQPVLAVLLTLFVLYLVGRVTSQVIGRQAFSLFEAALERLPFVAKVYTSVRQLLDSMMAKKESNQRVVLIDFPIMGQKSIGFLTRVFPDSTSGALLAAVLVPNAINPTSAFLQILPLECVTDTDMNMEQAMSMIMTGGAVGPETIRFTRPAS